MCYVEELCRQGSTRGCNLPGRFLGEEKKKTQPCELLSIYFALLLLLWTLASADSG